MHDDPTSPLTQQPGFRELFTPKLVTVLREGYGLTAFRADALAGLTVAIVALPLSMAIAIASGTTPDRGLYAAIVGGFLVSAFGGSRFQVGGPAGAFIVLVAATVERHGVEGLILATMISGIILIAIGFLRIGAYIKFIPYPVTLGFTAGIALIIFASQITDLFGLKIDGREPLALVAKLSVLWPALPGADPSALLVSAVTIGGILAIKRWRPAWPAILIAIAGASFLAAAGLGVETVGSRFGGIPNSLPVPALPQIDMIRIAAILPDAVAFALLGSIESLLSAVVADGMTGRRHRSNCELVAQGIANVGSALFGGICVTGTIARTATNVRSGAHGPVSGMLHSLFLLGFMMLAAPLAAFIPLASLAGVLAVVAYNMVEKHAIAAIFRSSKGDLVVLAVTFLLTIFMGLTEGILAGFLIGVLLFIDRMSKSVAVEYQGPILARDVADAAIEDRRPYDPSTASDPDTVVYRISGACFFGTASMVASVLDRIADQRRNFILDFQSVPFLDSTAAHVIEGAAIKAKRRGLRLVIAGASPQIRRMLAELGVKPPNVAFAASIDDARRTISALAPD